MKKLLLDIYYVWVNELKIIFKDPAVVILFFLVPLAYPIVYSYIYNNEVAREIKVVVVDDSNSALSREFKRKVDATPDVQIIGYAANIEEAKEAMARKEAYGIFYIPNDFSTQLHTLRQAHVGIYADMSSLLFYKGMLLSATEVSLDMGAEIRVEESDGKSRAMDEVIMHPVKNEWVSFYNPTNGFASFFVPAILILIIQQTLLLGIATIVGTHNDKKRFTMASHTAAGKNVGALKLTIGKAFCYSALYMIVCAWVLRVVPYLFDLPQIGDPLVIAAFLMPYLLAATFFSMTLSYFCSQREFAMLLFVFTSLLFVFLSGISWPWTAIPPPLKAVAYIIPSTPGIHGFVKINTMGATLSDVWPEYSMLWIQSVVYCLLSVLMYKWWIVNYDPMHRGMVHQTYKKTVVE